MKGVCAHPQRHKSCVQLWRPSKRVHSIHRAHAQMRGNARNCIETALTGASRLHAEARQRTDQLGRARPCSVCVANAEAGARPYDCSSFCLTLLSAFDLCSHEGQPGSQTGNCIWTCPSSKFEVVEEDHRKALVLRLASITRSLQGIFCDKPLSSSICDQTCWLAKAL